MKDNGSKILCMCVVGLFSTDTKPTNVSENTIAVEFDTGLMYVFQSGSWNQLNYPYVNVKAFGAKGDGVNNDGPAIQNALNYASQFEDAIIYFPKGNYKVTSDITIPIMRTLRFIGDGHGERSEYAMWGGSSIQLVGATLQYAGTSWTNDGLHFTAERMKFALDGGYIKLQYSYFNLYDSALYIQGNYPNNVVIIDLGAGGSRQLPLIWKNVQITDKRFSNTGSYLIDLWYEGIDIRDVDIVLAVDPTLYSYSNMKMFKVTGNTFLNVDGLNVFTIPNLRNSAAVPYDAMFWIYDDTEDIKLRHVQFPEARFFSKSHIYGHDSNPNDGITHIMLTIDGTRLREEGDFMLPTWSSAPNVVIHPIVKTIGERKVTINAGTTLGIMEGIVYVDATANPITITLPEIANTWEGREITIIKTDSTANAVTINANTNQMIESSSSIQLVSRYNKAGLLYDANSNIWIRIK